MIYQLHLQLKDGQLGSFMYQFEIDDNLNSGKTYAEGEKHIKIAEKKSPLPEGATWLLCNENSKHFVGVKNESDMEGK